MGRLDSRTGRIIRGRIDHGIEDSISELILFGTSFSAPPKLATATDAVNAAGELTANARARLDAFVEAIDELDTERFRMVLDFLRRRQITQDELTPFLSGNLRRFALEEAGLAAIRPAPMWRCRQKLLCSSTSPLKIRCVR